MPQRRPALAYAQEIVVQPPQPGSVRVLGPGPGEAGGRKGCSGLGVRHLLWKVEGCKLLMSPDADALHQIGILKGAEKQERTLFAVLLAHKEQRQMGRQEHQAGR